jgi:3-oxoacyl-[acyl-carrier protein] reductase
VSNKFALVTGGSTGIGTAICRALLDSGYEVVSLSRRPAPLDSPRAHSVLVDLADAAATQAAARDIARRWPVTTLVHNAGATRENLLQDASLEDLAILTQLHLGAPLTLLQATLPAMQAAKFGRVVLIGSRAMLGLAKRTAYSATKSGMVGMARTWALELGSQGITVNVVAPGPIEETEMFDKVLGDDNEKRQRLAASIPVRRVGRPEDVARAVTFFTAPEASFITGQTLLVCGGASLGSLAL